jgi:hypothetical protein
MTDYATPVPVGQPLHFAWQFSEAPHSVEFKWSEPKASPVVPETTSTWTAPSTQTGGPPTVNMDTAVTFHVDCVPTSTPGPAYWRVQAFDVDGNSIAVDEGVFPVRPSPLRN